MRDGRQNLLCNRGSKITQTTAAGQFDAVLTGAVTWSQWRTASLLKEEAHTEDATI